MAKQHKFTSPYGEVVLTFPVDSVHIEASSPLAGDWGLGWWHAHSCGDEAVFSRAFWRGELASGHRPPPAQAEVDAFIAPWGFAADLDLETSRLPAGHRSRVQAYSQGFNQARRRRSGEAPWTPEDSHLLARTLGFLEWWEVRLPQRNFLLRAWQAGLPWAKLADLWPDLGEEPSPTPWEGWKPAPPFSPEAQALVDRIRRFREGQVWCIPGSQTQGGRALLGAQYVSDVTDQGLPFVAARVETPDGVVCGLGRPGHPGFLAGRTERLAWHAAPAVDDTIDLRILGDQGKANTGRWAGAGKTGTLGALLDMETAVTADTARDQTKGQGSAALNWAAVDSEGQTSRWAQGPRWLRPHPREAWLPTVGNFDLRTGPRTPAPPPSEGASRVSTAFLEERLTTRSSPFVEQALAPLRFLLPDTEAGQKLRRWTGAPGPEAQVFERLYASVLDTFWSPSPLIPDPQSPVAQALAPVIDRLVQAPHSQWLPSHDKNHRLAEAVRRAFAPGQTAPPLLSRRAALPCWTEVDGSRHRIYAATVVVLAEPGSPHWKVFLTDDETEVPVLRRW